MYSIVQTSGVEETERPSRGDTALKSKPIRVSCVYWQVPAMQDQSSTVDTEATQRDHLVEKSHGQISLCNFTHRTPDRSHWVSAQRAVVLRIGSGCVPTEDKFSRDSIMVLPNLYSHGSLQFEQIHLSVELYTDRISL